MYVVRHGQSEFNVIFGATRQDPGIKDPTITDLGAAQIEETRAFLTDKPVTSMIVSPYTRTLQSADILRRDLAVLTEIEPLIREHKHFSCDIGTHASALSETWPHYDFSSLDEQWWPDDHENDAMVAARARRFFEKTQPRADWEGLVVVSHWGFIRGLCGLQVANGTVVKVDRAGTGTVVHVPDPC